jgi:MoaA/NifB/PqqE/SkfB family radical SAM enzyme
MEERHDFLLIDVTMIDGKIDARAGGMLGAAAQPFLDRLVEVFNSLKVIAKKGEANIYNLYNPPQPSRAGMKAFARKIREKIIGMVLPATANIAVTSKCQCDCVHCSYDLFKNTERPSLTTEELKSVTDQALALGANLIIYVGGEPLLNPDLYDLIRHVDKDQAIVSIFTNGLLLTRENCEKLVEAGLHCLYVSIDSPRPEVHNRLRGVKNLYGRTLEGAARARESGIYTGLSTYATSESLAKGEVEELINIAHDEGFHEITIFDCIPSGKYLKNTDMMLSREEKDQIRALAGKYQESDWDMGVIAQAVVNSPDGAGCFGAYTQLYMTAYGDVNPCDFNPITFGNVRRMSLADIWKKMVSHPDFCYRYASCRMQTPEYRAKYIDPLPCDVRLPVPIENYDTTPVPRNEFSGSHDAGELAGGR